MPADPRSRLESRVNSRHASCYHATPTCEKPRHTVEHMAGLISDSASQIHLLGSFQLEVRCRSTRLEKRTQRLLAYLAVHRSRQSRALIAAELWSGRDRLAWGALRQTILTVRWAGADLLVNSGPGSLELADHVQVDLHEAQAVATEILNGGGELAGLPELLFAGELLPHWTEPWLIIPRARYHQRRLDALLLVGRQLLRQGRLPTALDVARLVRDLDPLQEEPWELLLRGLRRSGDQPAVRREYRRYRRLLSESAPGSMVSPRIEALLGG